MQSFFFCQLQAPVKITKDHHNSNNSWFLWEEQAQLCNPDWHLILLGTCSGVSLGLHSSKTSIQQHLIYCSRKGLALLFSFCLWLRMDCFLDYCQKLKSSNKISTVPCLLRLTGRRIVAARSSAQEFSSVLMYRWHTSKTEYRGKFHKQSAQVKWVQ